MSNLVKWFFAETSRALTLRRLILVALMLFVSMGGIALALHIWHPPTQPLSCQGAAQSANPTEAENLCPGTTAWRPDQPLGSEHAIEGFSAPISVDVGEHISFYVSTSASSYSLQIFRLGWYQGLGGRLMYSSAALRGTNQPAPLLDPATRMVSCSNWRNPVALPVPTTWVSGVYIAKLLSSQGYIRYLYFVVRNDASTAPIDFQTSVLTYEAYNLWGGYSLYRGLDAQKNLVYNQRSYVVSFDRPFDREKGLGDFLLYSEYSMVRWMERTGYNMTYSTDIDTDLHGPLLLKHQLYLSVGHDEYWSTAMRSSVTRARDQGVSLAFFGSNNVYWHVRLQSSPLGADREVVCYRPGYVNNTVDPLAATNPREATILWRDKPLNEPENALVGEMYGGGVQGLAPLVLSSGSAPFLAGTGLHVGSALPGLVGGEYDRVSVGPTTPSSLTVLAASPLHCSTLCPPHGTDTANATLYTASSGSRVFAAGTFYWGWGLDDDGFAPQSMRHDSSPAFQKLTMHLLTYLLRS